MLFHLLTIFNSFFKRRITEEHAITTTCKLHSTMCRVSGGGDWLGVFLFLNRGQYPPAADPQKISSATDSVFALGQVIQDFLTAIPF